MQLRLRISESEYSHFFISVNSLTSNQELQKQIFQELAPIRGAHIKPVPDFGPPAINFSNFTPSPPPGAPQKPLSPRFNVEILKASAGRFLSDSKSDSSSSLTPEAAFFLKKQKLSQTESRSPEADFHINDM